MINVKWIIGGMGVACLMVSGGYFGLSRYKEIKADEAQVACNRFETHQTISTGQTCIQALRNIPFKSNEQKELIGKADVAVQAIVALNQLQNNLDEAFSDFEKEFAETQATIEAVDVVETVETVETPQAIERSFEDLSYCEQLDAIAVSGKSVSQFIIDSGELGNIDDCNWHSSQWDVAYNVLHPPTPPASIRVEASYPESSQQLTANSDVDLCLLSDPCHPHHGQWLGNQNNARGLSRDGTVPQWGGPNGLH